MPLIATKAVFVFFLIKGNTPLVVDVIKRNVDWLVSKVTLPRVKSLLTLTRVKSLSMVISNDVPTFNACVKVLITLKVIHLCLTCDAN